MDHFIGKTTPISRKNQLKETYTMKPALFANFTQQERKNWLLRCSADEFLNLWLSEKLLPPKQQQVLENYYKNYINRFGPYIRHHYACQQKEVLELKNLYSSPPKLLEIGTGCGSEALWFSLQGFEVFAVDIDPDHVAVATERKKLIENWLEASLPCQFLLENFLDLPESEQFDIIWMQQTFHHLEPREKVLDKIAALCKPGGFVVISELNAWNPLIQLQFFWKRGFPKIITVKKNDKEVLVGVERILSPCTLAHLLRKRGIIKRKIRLFRTLPSGNWSSKWLKWEKHIPQWFPLAFTHYNFVGQKHLKNFSQSPLTQKNSITKIENEEHTKRKSNPRLLSLFL